MDKSPLRIGYCLSLSGAFASDGKTAPRAVPNTAFAVATELFPDWASPLADKAREVIYWCFGEVTKLKADVGVSEKQGAKAKVPA